MRLLNFLKDPLIHFLVIGVVLFAVLSAASPAPQEESILVDRPAILSFIQYRSKAFEPRAAAALLDEMKPDARARLINDYIREEALYREAHALGLDQGDYVIRRRMVQKLEFMTEAATSEPAPDEVALGEYFERNKSDYFLQAGITFSHVFVSAKDRGQEKATAAATEILNQLRNDKATFSDATRYGDRFLFHTNYVERTYDYVKSHFGHSGAKAIFSDTEALSVWRGPIESEHGAHLVFVTAQSPGALPPMEDIRARVTSDFMREQKRSDANSLIEEIIEEYAPIIAPDLATANARVTKDQAPASGPDR